MARLIDWIVREASGEYVEAVFIGEMGWSDYNEPKGVEYKQAIGRKLTLEEAMPYLTYEFDAGYGAPGCTALLAYTKTWIIFVHEHDGATSAQRIPRNPIAGWIPGMY